MTRYRNQHTARAAADPNFASEPDRACAGADPEIFFPGTNHKPTEALDLCHTCPHQQACLDFALDTEQMFGIWAGTTPDDRRAMIRRRAAA